MEKNKIINLLIAGSITLLLLCLTGGIPNPLMLQPYELADFRLQDKHTIVNFLYNTYHTWHFDILLRHLLKKYDGGTLLITLYSLFFFSTGLVIYLRQKSNDFIAFCLTVLFLVVFFSIWQLDLVLLSSITWLPLFLLALDKFLKGTAGSSLFLAPLSILLITSANQLSVLYIAVAYLIYYVLYPKKPSLLKSYRTGVILIICFVAFLYLIKIPAPEFPTYPGDSRVITEDLIPGIHKATFGPDVSVEFKNLALERKIFFLPVLVLLLFQITSFYFSKQNKICWGILSGITLLALADIKLPPYLSDIMPLETLTRLIPHWIFLPLLAYLTSFLFILTLIFFVKQQQSNIAAALLTVTFLSSLYNHPEIRQLNLIKNFHYQEVPFKLINSPSINILLKNNLHIKYLKKASRKKAKNIHKKITDYLTNYNLESLPLAFDGVQDTRWSSKLASQTGDEKIAFQLKKPQEIIALELSSSESHTDFPRGLTVYYQEQCKDLTLNIKDYKLVFNRQKWPGSVVFTKSGYPYYTHQSKVRVILPPVMAKCILLAQTGKTKLFDWSISEIKVLSK